MPVRVATVDDHPDPGLRPRLYPADPDEVAAVLRSVLEDLAARSRWRLEDADGDPVRFRLRRRRWVPPWRDEAVLEVADHDGRVARVTAELERRGFPGWRFLARETLVTLLKPLDGQLVQAKDGPLRTEGYGAGAGAGRARARQVFEERYPGSPPGGSGPDEP